MEACKAQPCQLQPSVCKFLVLQPELNRVISGILNELSIFGMEEMANASASARM